MVELFEAEGWNPVTTNLPEKFSADIGYYYLAYHWSLIMGLTENAEEIKKIVSLKFPNRLFVIEIPAFKNGFYKRVNRKTLLERSIERKATFREKQRMRKKSILMKK